MVFNNEINVMPLELGRNCVANGENIVKVDTISHGVERNADKLGSLSTVVFSLKGC